MSKRAVACLEQVFSRVVTVEKVVFPTVHREYKRFVGMYTWLDACLTKFALFNLDEVWHLLSLP